MPESPLREDEPNRHGYLVEQDQLGFLAVLTDGPFPDGTPRNVKEALNDNTWRISMEVEYEAHIKNGTWELVGKRPGMNVIGSTWTYTIKKDQNGDPVKHKSRLCAQGFSQVYGVDYEETFSPVVEINTIRLLLSFSARHSLTIHQADVPTAYLNVSVDKEIYMRQPAGFVVRGQGEGEVVCQLKRAIYGLKQAGRRWWSLFHTFIVDMGFTQSGTDMCLYYLKCCRHCTFLVIYVDDVLIVSTSERIRLNTLDLLQERFDIKVLGPATWILSLHITQRASGITLDQSSYICDILKRYGMESCNPAYTPMATSIPSASDKGNSLSKTNHALYRSIVGSLMYIATCTRPDISFAVGELGRYTHQPTEAHLTAAKRVLRYLRGTGHARIKYKSQRGDDESSKLVGYADADFASDMETRRSVSGHIFTIGESPVAWRSKRQLITATSTTEAEYIALSDCSKISLALGNIVKELTNVDPFPIAIHEDNRAASLIAKNESSAKRTKHIDVKYHHIRDLVNSGKICIVDIASDDQLADALTKPLPREKHERFTSRILENEGRGIPTVQTGSTKLKTKVEGDHS